MLNNHEVYILNENVSNSTNNIIIDNVNNNNVNDYIYDQIYVKNKKTTNINKNKNKKFIKKYMGKTTFNTPKSNNIINN